jgi:pimeloyl-ACP methyl ester carboxylesterase
MDKNVRAILGGSVAKGDFKDEIKAVAGLSCPIAFIQGEQDQFVNNYYFKDLDIPTLWYNSVQIISNFGHSPHWEKPENLIN